jgi:hypothetical protein
VARSANLNFFATAADQVELLDFLFSATDVRIFESYSSFGSELREFRSSSEVGAALPLGVDSSGNGHSVLLQLWSPSVMAHLKVEKVSLDPAACGGHTFRHRIDGAGLMQLYFGGVFEKVVTMSHFGHQSQKRAETWGASSDVNWDALSKISGRIQYHLRHRLAAGKVPGRPVLRQAMSLAQAGYLLKLAAQTPWQFELLPQ